MNSTQQLKLIRAVPTPVLTPREYVDKEDSRPIFERLKDEDAWDFYAFQLYRNQPPHERNINLVARQLEVNRETIALRRRKHNWEERALAWDDEVDRVSRNARLEEVAEMNKRHATNAASMQQVYMLPVTVLAQRLSEDKDLAKTFEKMNVEDLLDKVVSIGKVMPGVSKLERSARGVNDNAGNNVSNNTTIDQIVNIKEVKYNVVKSETNNNA